MKRIVIVTACDDKYSPHCGALAASIFHNNTTCQIEFNILTDYISPGNKGKFAQLANDFHQTINIINVDKSRFDNMPIGELFEDHINISTYYRLLITEVFSTEDKILYLDSDIIVRKNLANLWDTDLEGFAFGGVRDITAMQQSCPIRLQYPVFDSYYNAGVGLYNLKYLRQTNFEGIVADFIKNNFSLIVCHDQDILNACFHGRFKSISETWNMVNDFLLYRYSYCGENEEAFNRAKKDCAIVHFTTSMKPWYKECQNPYKYEYWKYLKMTLWKDNKEISFFKNRWARFIYLLKGYLKVILLAVGIKRGFVRL